MDPKLRKLIGARIRHADVPLFGIAPADRWEDAPFEPWVPRDFHPRSIFPECRSVIVIGYPISLPVLETTPSIHYHEMYKTVNALLDQTAYRLSLYLDQMGYASIYIPRDGYGSLGVLKDRPMAFFSHRHAAYMAGLGTFGHNNMLLTRDYGPRVRFTSIFTAAEIAPDQMMNEQLCIRCGRCVKACPVNALAGKDYPQVLTDKEACRQRSEELLRRYISPCGICIKVCPVGNDRKLYGREDMSIYKDESEPTPLHDAWKHVRSYSGKQ
ncbi:MAG TPA: 4Fe-4S binding protein [Methanomassiliicoccales archaeon]|nr:4Fe-4S binding protein [Methanomassiliicoccales archaeon]